MLKLGERGVLACSSKAHEDLDSYFVIDSFVDNLVDAVGAGDALLAYSTLAMLVSQNNAIATTLGTIAAACECEQDGNVPITPGHVLEKLDKIERQINFT
jgi:sugar/nucleoside kinase (ribokinase family)